MKKIYALFMTLCLVISATAAPLAGVAKKSYPLYQPEVVKAELALDAMQKAPAATQGLQYDAEAGELIRYYNETDQIDINADYLAQGNLYIDIMAGDQSDYLTLLLFVEDTVEGAIIPEGTYPITSEPAYNTALASQGYVAGEGVYPCAYYPLVEQGGTLYINTPMYFMQSGNIVVEHVNGAPKITINAVNSNNVPMTIVYEVGGKSEKVEVKVPLQYDATEADGALDYTFAEGATATATDKDFYGTYVVVAADASSELALLFIYPEGVADAETTIPEGTYTISDSQAPGTVMASSGVSSTGGVSYSFFANIDAEGYLEIPLYFLVSGTVEVTKVDGKLKVEVNGLNSNDVLVHVVYDATSAEPEYALEETIEISNLTTDILTVGEATYLQLTGRNDMLDSDVQLFLNNYTSEDKEYEVNVENSLMTFGGIELTVVEGKIAQATDPEKGQVYTGRVIASAEEEGEVMLVALDLIMYAAPAIELEIADAQAIVDETTGTLLFTASWTDTTTMVAYPVMVTVAGFEDVEFKEYEGAQISELQIGDDDNWYDYAVANAVAVFKDGNAVALEGEYTSWATGATYYVTIEGTLPVVEESVEMVGVVKRALQYYDATIVLTHEADGTAHIYNVVDGVVAEVSQEGVIAVDAENPGSYLAISDIALTEDGKLVANNYIRCSFNDGVVESGYKRGTLTFYIWEDLAAAPAIWFQSKASSNSNNSDQGYTMAVTGTSTNANILVSGVHNTQRGVRMSHFSIVDGVFEDTQDGSANLPYYYYVGSNFKGASAGADAAVFNEQTHGANIQFHASPLTPENWIIDGELTNPIEFINPQTHGGEVVINATLSDDLGKKYNGASIVTVGEQVLMVAPYATAEGLLAGVKVLDITAGLAAAVEVNVLDLDAPVEATAAATAVQVVEGGLNINLVADATIYPLTTVAEGPDYMSFEDEITNLVIDLENMAIIGGPSTMWQVEVFLGLAEDDNMDGQWSLSPESSVAIMGFDARLIDGYVYDIDVNAPAAKAVLYVEDSGFFYEFKLNMTSTPTEAIVVVVEDATVQIDTIPLFGDAVDYALKMTGDWTYAEDGVTYPVLVEVPVYYPEATEPSEMTCTVTIGGMGDDDPWLGFGEGTLTITTEGGVVTAKGLVANPYTGVAFDVTVSGKLPQDPGHGTGIEDVELEVKAVKVIKNCQLIIKKGDAQFNVQGAQVK